MNEIKKIINAIALNKELKEELETDKIIIYNRNIKTTLQEICAAYKQKDTNLITYNVVNNKNNLDLAGTNSINLELNVWSKISQNKADKITEMLKDIIENTEGIVLFEMYSYQNYDDIYYRNTLSVTYLNI